MWNNRLGTLKNSQNRIKQFKKLQEFHLDFTETGQILLYWVKNINLFSFTNMQKIAAKSEKKKNTKNYTKINVAQIGNYCFSFFWFFINISVGFSICDFIRGEEIWESFDILENLKWLIRFYPNRRTRKHICL